MLVVQLFITSRYGYSLPLNRAYPTRLVSIVATMKPSGLDDLSMGVVSGLTPKVAPSPRFERELNAPKALVLPLHQEGMKPLFRQTGTTENPF